MASKISKYVSKEDLARVGEDVVEDIVKKLIVPAAEKAVADTESKWDDVAVATFKPLIYDLVDQIDKTDN